MRDALAPTANRPFELNGKLAAGLGLAAAIAWFLPFDFAFDTATFGVAPLRAATMAGLALAGLAVGGKVGLGIEPRGLQRPVLTPLAVAAVVAVACAASDWLFRPALHGSYMRVMSAPLGLRMAVYMARAFNENILYRLFLGSALVWIIGHVWKTPDERPATGAFWTGFAVSQALNVWINVTSQAPVTPVAVLHDALRYFAPGLVWSWLYWRRGFQSNEIASVGVHLFFQPLVTFGLA